MKIDEIMALRPRDGSSVEIKAALQRAQAMHDATAASLTMLVAQGTDILLTGSAKEMATQDMAVRQARETLQQLQGMTAAMEGLLGEALRQEEIASLRADFAALNIEAHAQSFATFWQTEYPDLARNLVVGLELEAKATASTARAHQIAAKLTELGQLAPAIPDSSALAVGPMLHGRRLSDLVRLPGVAGAPFVGVERYAEHITEVKTVIDYDNPIPPPDLGKTRSYGGVPMLGNQYPTKKVEVKRTELRERFARQDTPLWPVDARAWAL